ncbi:hypothetical protein EYF80_058295 [Liparis tanakae]|uniref:Uncharacterized protein n=1 Tax=Liparis tanakae TaxID=230148 RepID=A0A4Z2ERZ1_9TELE|nr:hypothetical protein EYF80_058295 [Liparis tanakae]
MRVEVVRVEDVRVEGVRVEACRLQEDPTALQCVPSGLVSGSLLPISSGPSAVSELWYLTRYRVEPQRVEVSSDRPGSVHTSCSVHLEAGVWRLHASCEAPRGADY